MTIGLRLHFELLDAVERECMKRGYAIGHKREKGQQLYEIRNAKGHMISGWHDLHGTAMKLFPERVCKHCNKACRVLNKDTFCCYPVDAEEAEVYSDKIEDAVRKIVEKEDLTLRVAKSWFEKNYNIYDRVANSRFDKSYNIYDMDGCVVLCDCTLQDIYNFLQKV